MARGIILCDAISFVISRVVGGAAIPGFGGKGGPDPSFILKVVQLHLC